MIRRCVFFSFIFHSNFIRRSRMIVFSITDKREIENGSSDICARDCSYPFFEGTARKIWVFWRTSNKNASQGIFSVLCGKRIIFGSECHEHYVFALFQDSACAPHSHSHSLTRVQPKTLTYSLSLLHIYTFPTHIRYSEQKGEILDFPLLWLNKVFGRYRLYQGIRL